MSKEKVRLAPDAVSSKWGTHMKSAVPDIVSGVTALTEDPGQKAVAAQEKMLAKITESITSGVWAKRRLEVSLPEWKEKTIAKVKSRLSGGVDGAMPKRKKFDVWLVGRLNAVLPTISAMPSMTLEDSKQRMIALVDHMAGERYKGS